MENKLIATTFMAVGIACAIVLVAGCDEQSKADIKRCRLIADENRQLKQKTELNLKEIENQKELLDKCQQEKKELEDTTQRYFSSEGNDIAGLIMLENTALRKENEELRAQLAEPNKPADSNSSQ